jgi:hypothetical protein
VTSASGAYRKLGLAELREACGMEPLGKYAGDTTCRMCLKTFHSTDKRAIRICNDCKTTSDWVGGDTSPRGAIENLGGYDEEY